MAALRGNAGQPFRNTQQSERAVHLGQMPPGDVAIPRGCVDGAVAEQELDRVQIHPGFQQMGGKAMAPRMDALAVGDPRAPLGVVGDLLRGGDGQGLGAVLSHKEPRRRAIELPVGAQFGQQTDRQQSVAVFASFALMNADQQAVTCDVGEAQAHDFPNAQARGIGGHEQGPMPRVGGAREQALECFDTHQVRQEPPSCAWGYVEVERIPAEGRDREKLEPTGYLVPGTPREVAFDK